MKEVKEAQKQFWILKTQIDEQIGLYNDLLLYDRGGEKMEKKTVTFQRTKLYEEIWEKSLSTVAKLYEVPNLKLRDACNKANIPLPSLSYWGSLHSGKKVEKDPLPNSTQDTVTISFTVREKAPEEKASAPQVDTKAIVSAVSEPIAPLKKSFRGGNLYEREILYQEVWSAPVTKVAEKYDVSDVMIHKICKALNVPVPPRGYWAKKQAGQDLPQTPLPEHTGRTEYYGSKIAHVPVEEKDVDSIDDALLFLPADELEKVWKQCLEIKVDPEKKKYHSVLIQHSAAYKAYAKKHPRDPLAPWSKDTYHHAPSDEPPLYERVSEGSLPRVYRILDALYSAIEALGGKINKDLSVQIRGEHVTFSITEGQEQVKHVLTKEEQKQWDEYEIAKRRSKYAYELHFRKYDYLPTGRLTVSVNKSGYYRDSTENVLENRLGEPLHAFYMQSEVVRIEREAKEAAQRKVEEEKRQRELRRQLYNEEVKRLDALKNEAADFEMACRIRAYASAVAQKENLTPAEIEWIAWAQAKAAWYDPTISATDPLLGKRDHANPKEPAERYWNY